MAEKVTLQKNTQTVEPVSYTHLRAHETKANLVCRLLLEKTIAYGYACDPNFIYGQFNLKIDLSY